MTRDAPGADHTAILALIRTAFPDEDLVPLTTRLLRDRRVRALVAEDNGALTGLICWTGCTVGKNNVALLGPLAVCPDHRKAGIGSDLIKRALADLTYAGFAQALVLGDPAYYGRFGFEQEDAILPPYPIPSEWKSAWQSQVLAGPYAKGPLAVPTPWQDPKLWSD